MLKQQIFTRLPILTGFIILLLTSLTARASEIWIDIDTTKHTLSVMKGDTVQTVFENIAIGRFGTTYTKVRNDDKTPLGKFRISWINTKSRYYQFYGFDYPDPETAKRALAENRITKETWQSIRRATEAGRTPPQDTALGGHIGIHGIGRGDRRVHDRLNWTNGCIALTNEQIDRLNRWITPGIMVEVR